MTPLFFDVETTGATNESYGHPFDPRNKLCYIGLRTGNCDNLYSIDLDGQPYGRALDSVMGRISSDQFLVVGFNIKFDLHWIRRYGIPYPKMIWDLQYAQFCIWRQKKVYPSLDQCLEYYGFPKKLDVVEKEYWEKGIDTDQVPPEIVLEYLAGDLIRTQWVYESQMNYLADKPELMRLIMLGNMDILVTAEMEWNGFKYDNESSIKKGQEIEARIAEIDSRLGSYVDSVTPDWNSPDFLSAFLFGGVVKEQVREKTERTLKDGTIKVGERWATAEHELPALIKAPASAKRAKEGFYSTNKETLVALKSKATKKVKAIIDMLLERSELEKLMSTYYYGFPKIYEKKHWENDVYHPQINHVVARTGRLSTLQPNEQNIPDPIRQLLVTRYA